MSSSLCHIWLCNFISWSSSKIVLVWSILAGFDQIKVQTNSKLHWGPEASDGLIFFFFFSCVFLTLYSSVILRGLLLLLLSYLIAINHLMYHFCFSFGFWLADVSSIFRVIAPPVALACTWHHLTACTCHWIWTRLFLNIAGGCGRNLKQEAKKEHFLKHCCAAFVTVVFMHFWIWMSSSRLNMEPNTVLTESQLCC